MITICSSNLLQIPFIFSCCQPAVSAVAKDQGCMCAHVRTLVCVCVCVWVCACMRETDSVSERQTEISWVSWLMKACKCLTTQPHTCTYKRTRAHTDAQKRFNRKGSAIVIVIVVWNCICEQKTSYCCANKGGDDKGVCVCVCLCFCMLVHWPCCVSALSYGFITQSHTRTFWKGSTEKSASLCHKTLRALFMAYKQVSDNTRTSPIFPTPFAVRLQENFVLKTTENPGWNSSSVLMEANFVSMRCEGLNLCCALASILHVETVVVYRSPHPDQTRTQPLI